MAVDFSEHRLMKIAPIVFEQLQGDSEKYEPILGDFLQFDHEEVFDVAIFCQSLYMFPNLDKTLAKIRGLLVQGRPDNHCLRTNRFFLPLVFTQVYLKKNKAPHPWESRLDRELWLRRLGVSPCHGAGGF